MARLTDKVAVVLGASAEHGIGWAIAEALAQAGAKVIVAARRLEPLKVLAGKIHGEAFGCDATVEQEVEALAAFVLKRHGRLDIAVNSAATPVPGSIAASPTGDALKAMEANYLPAVFFVKHMAAAMRENGSIVLISSMSATHAMTPSFFPYACAKAAIDCLVRFAALEYGSRQIRVNSILPGTVRTDMIRPFLEQPGIENKLREMVPLGRISEARDIADAAVWLCGPSFVTGLNLHVSGGNQLTGYPCTPAQWSDA